MKLHRHGLMAKFSNEPDFYVHQTQTSQEKAVPDAPHKFRTFRSQGDEGYIDVQNKLIRVRVWGDGRVEIFPHNQILDSIEGE